MKLDQEPLKNPKVISRFKLITDDGVVYTFGSEASAIEYSIMITHPSSQYHYWFANSWYLTKIEHPKGDIVNFTYERDNYISQLYDTYYENVENSFDCFSIQVGHHPGGNIISPVYLSSIESSTVKITFDRSQTSELRYDNDDYPYYSSNWKELRDAYPMLFFDELSWSLHPSKGFENSGNSTKQSGLNGIQWKKLDNIKIYNTFSEEKLKEKISFVYLDKPTDRLFLEKVIKEDSEQKEDNVYKFSYHGKNTYPRDGEPIYPLTKYVAWQVDNWGFYCKSVLREESTDIMARSKVDVRDQEIGTLSEIHYPTGGYTKFVYDTHTYSRQLEIDQRWKPLIVHTEDKKAGGLRIASISNFDGDGKLLSSKEYKYILENGLSSGTLSTLPFYESQYRFLNIDKRVMSSQSVVATSPNSMSSHVRYSKVLEENSDGSYSEYNFTDFSNGHGDEKPLKSAVLNGFFRELPCNSKEQERGKLLSRIDYSKERKPVYKIYKDYTTIDTTETEVRGIRSNRIELCSGLLYNAVGYKVYTYSYLPTKETEIFYDLKSNITTQKIKNITYNNYKQISSSTIETSEGDKIKEVFKYTSDYIDLLENCKDNYYKRLEQLKNTYEQNQKSRCGYDSQNGGVPSQDAQKCLYELELQYKRDVTSAEATYNTCLNTDNAFTKYGPIGVYARDKNGISYLVSKNTFLNKKDNKWYLLNSSFTEYQKSNNSSNYIVPARYCEMNFSTPQLVDDSDKFYTTMYNIDSRYVTKTEYTKYDDYGNLLEVKTDNGLTFVYLWSYKGQYPIAKIENANYETVKTALGVTLESISKMDIPEMSTIDALRTNLREALVTTYTYKSLGGIATMTDPRGVVTYYEYDDFERLTKTYVKENGEERILQTYDYHYSKQK